MNKSRKRTFSIAEVTITKLDKIRDYYHINKATMIRMAIYHGLERMKQGYCPTKDERYKRKKKIDIVLPEETWEEFEDIVYSIEQHIKEKYKNTKNKTIDGYILSHSKIIQNLIDIEIERFNRIIDLQEGEIDNYEWQEIPTRTINITAEVPWYIDKKIQDELLKTGLLETQLQRYYIANGIIKEYLHEGFNIIDTDDNLHTYIDALRLNPYKTKLLLKLLLEAGKIVFY